MDLDAGTVISLVGLALVIAGGVFRFGQQAQELNTVKENLKKLEDHNQEQHRELYESRNDMRDVLTRLTALFESMKEKQESMDAKLDILIERRGTPRG